MAVVSAVLAHAAESVQGESLRSMQNRITWGFRESGHVFRIAHEHTLAPLGFEDSKAILTLGRSRASLRSRCP